MSATPGHEPRDGRLPARGTPAGAIRAPRPGRVRRAAGRILELVLILLLTLVCFVAVLVMLERVFPSATGLRELMGAERAGMSRSVRPPAGRADDEGHWASAVLSVLDNEVLRKASGTVVWDPARDGARVREGDGVQTTRAGMAVLAFDREDWLRLGRNSLVILRPAADLDGERRTASLTLVAGEVWGEFAGHRGGSVRLEVAGARRAVLVAGDSTGRAPSRFKVTVGRDHSMAIAVYAGRTTLTVGERSLRIGPSQYVLMRPGEVAGSVHTLPDAPAVLAPTDGGTWRFREFPPAVTFRWSGPAEAGFHRLVIARDPAFRSVVFDETVAGDSIALGSLPPGEYVWRVSATNAGVDGMPSPARRLSLVLDDVPPALRVGFPDGPVEDERCSVEGVTEPDCRLFVAGVQVTAGADGHFRCDARLRPGANLMVVEAVDAAGNSTYRSQIVRRMVQH